MEMAMDSRAAIQMLKFGRIWKKIRSAWCHLTIRVNSFRLIQQPDPHYATLCLIKILTFRLHPLSPTESRTMSPIKKKSMQTEKGL
jgi:hypothetical protein